MKKVSIVGIGWLGFFIAKERFKKGWQVVGTTRTNQKKEVLEKYVTHQVVYNLEDISEETHELECILNTNWLILTIPPSSSPHYTENIVGLVTQLKRYNPKANVIYLSSISVYGEQQGVISEQSPIQPITENAMKIAKLEERLNYLLRDKLFILRLGGLIGEDRHPINFLSGRKLKKPDQPVNLVHQEDVVRLIAEIMDEGLLSGLYNVCSPEHPDKSAYYSWVATQKKIAPPTFSFSEKKVDKVVTCETIKETNFQFKYPSPYDFPI